MKRYPARWVVHACMYFIQLFHSDEDSTLNISPVYIGYSWGQPLQGSGVESQRHNGTRIEQSTKIGNSIGILISQLVHNSTIVTFAVTRKCSTVNEQSFLQFKFTLIRSQRASYPARYPLICKHWAAFSPHYPKSCRSGSLHGGHRPSLTWICRDNLHTIAAQYRILQR